jgi:hypothetical protein
MHSFVLQEQAQQCCREKAAAAASDAGGTAHVVSGEAMVQVIGVVTCFG